MMLGRRLGRSQWGAWACWKEVSARRRMSRLLVVRRRRKIATAAVSEWRDAVAEAVVERADRHREGLEDKVEELGCGMQVPRP